jgi:serine/threonine-protein kinase RsbT
MTTPHLETGLCMSVVADSDVDMARMRTHRLAIDEGLTDVDATAIATAVSELARNVLAHAARGMVTLSVVAEEGRHGIAAVVKDDGPGITDTERAMEDGYSSTGTLGLGLPSARRLADDFHLLSVLGVGTTVTVKKWNQR